MGRGGKVPNRVQNIRYGVDNFSAPVTTGKTTRPVMCKFRIRGRNNRAKKTGKTPESLEGGMGTLVTGAHQTSPDKEVPGEVHIGE